ncbi:glycosyltransferase [Leucobacter tardus]|uniref:Glycosyltransferase n=1 Tax=Leucobacter tardus TaxID=501483 RepID=A0A939QDQ6_9MICO|nr:glycosyltransferase [Leucobacter tardus]MBO2989917.1 glycosyltransferase [Leucobacter tardus]
MISYRVDIVIPARNEQDLLPRALTSVRRSTAAASEYLRRPTAAGRTPSCVSGLVFAAGVLDARVTVVADRCTDDTVLIARRLADRVLLVDAESVGDARDRGCGAPWGRAVDDHIGRPRAGQRKSNAMLLTTDADSTVPAHWVLEHLAHRVDGADAIAGTVAVEDWGGRDGALPERYCREYARSTDHVHGANLGISQGAYAQLDGFRSLQVGEDQDLIDRARALGLRVDTCHAAAVATSARRTARAPDGFSDYLDALELT